MAIIVAGTRIDGFFSFGDVIDRNNTTTTPIAWSA